MPKLPSYIADIVIDFCGVIEGIFLYNIPALFLKDLCFPGRSKVLILEFFSHINQPCFIHTIFKLLRINRVFFIIKLCRAKPN